MTKIDIISGFLGAGKTTLIKKILIENPYNEKIAIIENEFGEIGIDGTLLKRDGIVVREIFSGCICCTLADNFEKSLDQVIKQFNPDRVIIEPTGIAKLPDVLKNCRKALKRENVGIGICLTVVNLLNYRMFMQNWREFFQSQIKYTGAVILSRTQKTDPDLIEEVTREIRSISPKVKIITTPWDLIDAKTILLASENDSSLSLVSQMEQEMHGHTLQCRHHEHNHDAVDLLEAWGMETSRAFSETYISNALQELKNQIYGKVIRSKGIIFLDTGKWMQFDFVTGEIDMRAADPDYTGRICVIGDKLNKPALNKLFR